MKISALPIRHYLTWMKFLKTSKRCKPIDNYQNPPSLSQLTTKKATAWPKARSISTSKWKQAQAKLTLTYAPYLRWTNNTAGQNLLSSCPVSLFVKAWTKALAWWRMTYWQNTAKSHEPLSTIPKICINYKNLVMMVALISWLLMYKRLMPQAKMQEKFTGK